jgi:hypothetical protein
MAEDTHDASAIAEDNRARPFLDHAARRALVAKAGLMLTLLASVCGWLWLLGKGLVAFARNF